MSESVNSRSLPEPLRRVPERLFSPLSDRVALHVFTPTESEGGIALPDTARSRDFHTPACLVIAVGPDVKWVREGDRVFAEPGLQIRHGGNEWIVVREEKVIGIISRSEERTPPVLEPSKKTE